MTGFSRVDRDGTDKFGNQVLETYPRLSQNCNAEGTTPLEAPTNGEFRVSERDGRWAVEQWMGDGWVAIGLYDDRAVADEIVQIACSDPDHRHPSDGSSPDYAIPFSSFQLDDEGDLDFLAVDGAEWV